jgi:dCTP deaminase
MILSDADIRRALREGAITVDPVPPRENISTSAVDLRVGAEFRRWKDAPRGIDINMNLSNVSLPDYGDYVEDLSPDQDGLIAVPRDGFLLARTLERIELPIASRLAARVEGRSSFARLGLAVHITAPTVHAGFEGPIVLEIKNLGPFTLKLEPGVTRICQIIFEQVSSEPEGPLITGFQQQTDVLGGSPPSGTS